MMHPDFSQASWLNKPRHVQVVIGHIGEDDAEGAGEAGDEGDEG